VSNPEDYKREQQPPYLDPSLVIDTRLADIERQNREDKTEAKKHNRSQRATNWLLTLFTGLLFVTSFASNIFLWQQTALTKKSADAAKSAAKTASDALAQAKIDSATHDQRAQQTSDASINASRLDQRAWVGIDRVESQVSMGGLITDNASVQFLRVVIKNSGKTPAIRLSGSCCIIATRRFSEPIPDHDAAFAETEAQYQRERQMFRKWVPNPIQPMPPSLSDVHTGGVLAPTVSQAVSLMVSVSIPKKDKSDWPATTYFLGKFTYNDIFPGTPRHTTKFCLMHVVGNEIVACPESNWMD
jgi:hypothetical protein